ncbi:hypothetical protein GLE_3049 [Lysobacter enzymogenes]|uniref:Lipoprotein n=1 Tax=Lysobacter enzymogenes TaxID=69 RepID=A0A0S2DIN2_LYSEN|nr:hypothetical protein GLE_3049 [Lysobacter enzymogenes]
MIRACMIRVPLLVLSLLAPLGAGAYEPARTPIQAPVPAPAASAAVSVPSAAAAPAPATVAAPAPAPVASVPAAPASSAPAPVATAPTVVASKAVALPPMRFLASVAEEEIYTGLKSDPNFAALDKELVGSPLSLMVTHTLRPTAGGMAAGLLSAVLAGSTLGLIPMVSSERLVIKYDVMLNGRPLTGYTFERTATRAQNLWAVDAGGLGKAGMEWVKSTVPDAAAKIAKDPAVLALRQEMDFYFPPETVAARK